jgi:2,2-dialkylglycine decarboxylase (pyruvate)
MRNWPTNPFQDITLSYGKGCKVWDDQGKSYLDLLSGTWCSVLGHGHPRLISAINNQAERLIHTPSAFLSDEIEMALSKLAEILPRELNRAVFLNTGSEAVELALKMARSAKNRDGLVIMERGYYGATSYALSLSEIGRGVGYLPSFGSIHRIPAPNCLDCPMNLSWPCDPRFACLHSLEELSQGPGKLPAAVIYEPVMGNGGIIVPPRGYGTRLREVTSKCDALLIAEEVTTGLGRTGRWFAFQHENILPDILVLGKALGAGLPVSAVISTEEVAERCRNRVTHVQSHQNDSFSGRIASTVISIIQDENLVQKAGEMGRYLMEGLRNIKRYAPSIRDVRGLGAMVGVELDSDWSDRGPDMILALLERGFILDYRAPYSTFRLFPPYIISQQEIDEFLHAFGKILTETA